MTLTFSLTLMTALLGAPTGPLLKDAARPPITHGVANTCWAPAVKNLVLQHNSIYNGWRLEDVWLDK